MSKGKLASICTVLVLVILFMVYKIPSTPRIIIENKITPSPKPEIKYSAWIPQWDELRAVDSLNSGASEKLAEILPTWYEINQNGEVVETKSDNKDAIKNLAKTKKLKITPTLVNRGKTGFDPELVSKLITNQDRTIDYLITTAINNKYSGWDLDLEEIHSADKERYSEFVKVLANKLHKSKLTLSVTVHAQSVNRKWSGSSGQDLEAIGKSADYVRIMAYDFHNSDSKPGPITPIRDLETTIDFAKSKVELNKIVIALPTYGYDWNNNKDGVPYQFQDMQNLIKEKEIKVYRDIDSGEMSGSYSNHRLWYVDAISIEKLVNIVKSRGITNLCFWRIGGEDISLWTKI